MIYSYGITQQGTYHIKKNIVCQDAHSIIKCNDSVVVAAVADGLGSEEHSDVASKIAADFSVKYCAERIAKELSDKEILEIIHEAFSLAQLEIEKEARSNSHELDQYDTTLALAILSNDTLYYGQSGDSGIIALTTEGLYEKVTEQQRDSEGRVFPLYFGDEKWVFGKYTKSVASVLLATDGMFEIFFPYLIKNEPINIYVALAKYFMDPDSLRISEIGENVVQDNMSHFIASIADEQVNDDKTVVVLMNCNLAISCQPEEYYAEPNWAELKRKRDEEWRRAAYPHLFAKKDETEAVDGENSAAPSKEEKSVPTDKKNKSLFGKRKKKQAANNLREEE